MKDLFVKTSNYQALEAGIEIAIEAGEDCWQLVRH